MSSFINKQLANKKPRLGNCLNFKIEVIYQVICSINCQAEKPALSLPKGSRSPLNHLNIFGLALNKCISTSLNVTEIEGFDI